MTTHHTCTTTLAPGAPWPAFQAGSIPRQPNFVPPTRQGRLTPEQLAQDSAKVIAAITQHGPCCLGRLVKHTDIGRYRTALALGKLARDQPQRIGIVRQEQWNNSVMSDIFGFLQ